MSNVEVEVHYACFLWCSGVQVLDFIPKMNDSKLMMTES